MFTRKLVVVVVPVLLAALVCLVFPLVAGIPFWTEVIRGLLLGVCLALLLPLSGATRKREPFAGLLWVPLVLLIIVAVCQGLWVYEVHNPVIDLLHTQDSSVILVECTFIGYLLVQMLRTKK